MHREVLRIILSVVLPLLVTPVTGHADVPLVVLTINDTTALADTYGNRVHITLTNVIDTIAGFEFVARSDNPSLLKFDFKNGAADTAGALTGRFEYVEAIDIYGDSSAVWFRCIANANPNDGHHTPGIPPQQDGLAVSLRFTTRAPVDSLSAQRVPLIIESPFGFSDPTGHGIGVHTDTIVDTFYQVCTSWVEGSCDTWVNVDPDSSDFDRILIDSSLSGYVDTGLVRPIHGGITIWNDLPCDFDGDKSVDIGDLTDFITCLFIDFGTCPLEPLCDYDADDTLDIGDLTGLIVYLFLEGSLPDSP
ncbi:MAG: hypothetical protein KKA42_06140 [candidate division Zixibacteria bacterium]|nr:hypothetical protein [candidate division Zixibacteria bacterium]